jgi:hypothetical protein
MALIPLTLFSLPLFPRTLSSPSGKQTNPPGKFGFRRGFGEHRSGAYGLYVSTGAEPKRSPNPKSPGVAT